MASPKPSLTSHSFSYRWLAYVAAALMFLWMCSGFYLPQERFTAFVQFGQNRSAAYIPELRSIDFYSEKNSDGYDAQYYAQIAMHPQLRDPVLRSAVDSLPYRARRILFCWTAYVAGLGRPAWALHVFSVQNIVAWLALGWVLLRWFPPTGWYNFFRWAAVMFTFGLTVSVRSALVDGPSLLLIAMGMALYERGRWRSAAVLLGVAGLGKETNLLAGAAVAYPASRDARSWTAAVGRGLIMILPLGLWLLLLRWWLGKAGDVGARNFDWPFVAYAHKWHEVWRDLNGEGSGVLGRAGVLLLCALTVQWLFFALRPRLHEAWWRMGASYAALMAVLGDAVWEGFPGAAPRVLLPMTLAFNILLPRQRKWLPVFLLGNLVVCLTPDTFVPLARGDTYVFGPHHLRVNEASGQEVTVKLDEREWYWMERSYFDYWRWAHGPATIRINNPHAFTLISHVRFKLKSSDVRNVTVSRGAAVLWSGPTGQGMPEVSLPELALPPGETVLQFDSDRPAAFPANGDNRKVAYRVCNFAISITGRSPER